MSIRSYIKKIKGVSLKEKLIFTRNLALIIKTGMSLPQGLSTLAEQTGSSYLRTVITEIRDEVTKGKEFSSALGEHTDIFNPFYVSMVKTGEASGSLEHILESLADHMAKEKAETEFITIIPVLPSSDIKRDIDWYKEHTGFIEYFSDEMYAILYRDKLTIHLQWHADTSEDPLLGGSVIRLYVKNIDALFKEFVQRGTVTVNALKLNTPWKTNEFGFFDLNNNAIFVMEDV